MYLKITAPGGEGERRVILVNPNLARDLENFDLTLKQDYRTHVTDMLVMFLQFD